MTDYGLYRVRLKRPLDHAKTVSTLQRHVEELGVALHLAQNDHPRKQTAARKRVLDAYSALADRMGDCLDRNRLN